MLDKDAPVLRRGLAGKGRDTAGPSSRDEGRVLQPLLHRTQERRWVTTNLGPVCSEPGPSQALVQDVDAETHLLMHPSFQLVRSDRPEGRILSCLDPPSTQTISTLCVRGASISVQVPAIRPSARGRILLSSGRSSPSASVQACCCINGCLCHGLGSHVQWACCCGALDRAPTAVAYQLPRSMACSAPLQIAATRQTGTGLYGQHWTIAYSHRMSHVATRPPSPPLESEASGVASHHSCPRRAQSCSQ